MIRSIQIAPNNTVYVHNLTAMDNDASSNVIYPRGEATVPTSAQSAACNPSSNATPSAAAWQCQQCNFHHVRRKWCHCSYALPHCHLRDRVIAWPCTLAHPSIPAPTH